MRVTPAQDGQIHRHDHPDGKRGNKRVWLVCRHNVAVWGDWGTGEQNTVFPDGQQDPEAARQARQEAERASRERQAEVERERAHVARQCRHEWPGLPAADPAHPYLVKKGIPPLALRQDGGKLIVPLYHELILANFQTIGPDGSKRFRTGGRKKGAYYPVGGLRPGVPLLVCEGVATGHTLHQATGYPVACAMDAGNLLPVARSLRARHPDLAIIVAADNDHRTDGNPGITAGRAAASAVGGRCVWPEFPQGAEGTDWNDLAAIGGEVSL
ncbi:toprim domain-containing protein [Halomonas almeriensis]|uniref:toprim domain-containing protein n=1 Tax=Halomonas almeriensis TaxID=308163 RepID=UPI0025B4378D|nr:toprim domain-containing protein [Halomonas almeriensis]